MEQGNQGIYVRRSSGLMREISGSHALAINIMGAGFFYAILNVMWGAALFPGANLAISALIGMILNLPISFLYFYFTVIMPRSGGDYIWMSRSLHPAVGFILNLGIVFSNVIIIGADVVWAFKYALGPAFYILGLITGNSVYFSVSQVFNSTIVIALTIVIWVIILGFIFTRRPKLLGRVILSLFIFALITIIIYIISNLVLANTTFINNFNKYSGMNYNNLISLGSSRGYPMVTLASATLFSTVYTFLEYEGITFSAYYGGELKNVQKSAFLSIVISTILLGVIIVAIYASTYYAFGFGFIQTIAMISQTGDPAWKLPFIPFTTVLWMFWNPVIGFIVILGFVIAMFAAMSSYLFVSTRSIFAYSFDRILPSWFAKVSKTGSPYTSSIFITILAVITGLLYIYTPAFEYLLYTADLMLIPFAVVGAIAIFFPFKKKEIFENAPDFIKKKVWKIPVLSIIGVLALGSSLFAIVSSFVPTFGGVIDPISIVYTFSIYIVGLVIYIIAHYYRKAKGLPLEYSFKEVPPL
jgi:amino acid transporter